MWGNMFFGVAVLKHSLSIQSLNKEQDLAMTVNKKPQVRGNE